MILLRKFPLCLAYVPMACVLDEKFDFASSQDPFASLRFLTPKEVCGSVKSVVWHPLFFSFLVNSGSRAFRADLLVGSSR